MGPFLTVQKYFLKNHDMEPDDPARKSLLELRDAQGVMTTALDSEGGAWVPCFTALDGSGAALWGTKNRTP